MTGMDKKRNVYGMVVGKAAGESSLGEPRRRWEDDMQLVLKRKSLEGRRLD